MSIMSIRQMAAVIRSVLAAARQYKPNLAVNDPDDPRYVSGRLCYETDPQEVQLAKETAFDLEETEGVAYAEDAFAFLLEPGKSYTVTWDGVKYIVVCAEYDGGYGVGNVSLYDDSVPDTGEPFYLETADGSTGMYVSGGGSHTVAVSTMGPRKIIPLPSKFLPDIPAEKLPEIPAEKLPDVFKTKDLVVELENFDFFALTQSTQPSFMVLNVTYAELLDAAKKSKVILKSVSRDFYVNQNHISCDSNGNIFIGISFIHGLYIHYIDLTCTANSAIFYRNSWSKVATE